MKTPLILKILNLKYKITAIYDTPETSSFQPIVHPIANKKSCIFAYFNQWNSGKYLCLTSENYACKGCGNWWFDKQSRTLEEFTNFLTETEGLKNSFKKMEDWILQNNPYQPEHNYLIIGPYIHELKKYAKTITFWVNADQLSVLNLAAYYFNEVHSPPPVMVPFGSGCMQALTLFESFNEPRAIVGSTDIAMRQYLPAEIFGFTVTLPMFDLFMQLDEKSFLSKPFLNTLIKARGGTL